MLTEFWFWVTVFLYICGYLQAGVFYQEINGDYDNYTKSQKIWMNISYCALWFLFVLAITVWVAVDKIKGMKS